MGAILLMLSCFCWYYNLKIAFAFIFILQLYHIVGQVSLWSLQIHFAYITAQYGLFPSSYIHTFDLSYTNIVLVHVHVHIASF